MMATKGESATISRGTVPLALGAGLPGAIVAVLFGLSGAAALSTGQPLIWAPAESTLSQATALRDQGEAIRLIMLGSDPNRRYPVDAVFRPDEQVMLTPLEAAVITRELYMVELVVDYGATVDAGNAAVLQCLATRLRADAILDYLLELSGPGPACAGVELPWQP
jgi:hypothetical protein